MSAGINRNQRVAGGLSRKERTNHQVHACLENGFIVAGLAGRRFAERRKSLRMLAIHCVELRPYLIRAFRERIVPRVVPCFLVTAVALDDRGEFVQAKELVARYAL